MLDDCGSSNLIFIRVYTHSLLFSDSFIWSFYSGRHRKSWEGRALLLYPTIACFSRFTEVGRDPCREAKEEIWVQQKKNGRKSEKKKGLLKVGACGRGRAISRLLFLITIHSILFQNKGNNKKKKKKASLPSLWMNFEKANK
jgi:hypothetical protein